MNVDHYCIGIGAGEYVHVSSDFEEVAPQLIVFESQDIANKFLGLRRKNYRVVKVNPYDLADHEVSLHDQNLFIGIDVRDDRLLCLDSTYFEFFNRLRWSFLLDEDREPLEMLPLQHQQSAPSDIEPVAETDVDQT